MNAIKIKVNNTTIALESSKSYDIEKMDKILSKESDNLAELIAKNTILSNVKVVESFGYRSTEGIGEKIKNAAVAVKNKLISWFKQLIEWITHLKAKMTVKDDASRQLLDIIHDKSKTNIKKLGSTIDNEELQIIRFDQKVMNMARGYVFKYNNILENLIFNKRGIKLSDIEQYLDFDPEEYEKVRANFAAASGKDIEASLKERNKTFQKTFAELGNIIINTNEYLDGKNVDDIKEKLDNQLDDLKTQAIRTYIKELNSAYKNMKNKK